MMISWSRNEDIPEAAPQSLTHQDLFPMLTVRTLILLYCDKELLQAIVSSSCISSTTCLTFGLVDINDLSFLTLILSQIGPQVEELAVLPLPSRWPYIPDLNTDPSYHNRFGLQFCTGLKEFCFLFNDPFNGNHAGTPRHKSLLTQSVVGILSTISSTVPRIVFSHSMDGDVENCLDWGEVDTKLKKMDGLKHVVFRLDELTECSTSAIGERLRVIMQSHLPSVSEKVRML